MEIALAEKLGVGSTDLKNARIVYCEENARKELPKSRKVVELQDAVEEVESCSACYGYLIPALEMLKNDGLFEKLDTKICIGQGYRGKTGKLGVGACTCKFEHNVKGCPPTENQIYDFLKQYILGDWYSYLRNDVLGSKSRSCLHDKTFESGTLFDFTMPSLSSV